jgi:HD-GYP domain-containing protein (c-di-GMP phosphodiesterase class II)
MGTDTAVPASSKPRSSCYRPNRAPTAGAWPEPRQIPAAADGALTEDYAIDGTEGILFALAHAVEQRDRQTSGHCDRLAFMAVALGMAMRLDRPALLSLYRGGFLHDVGKVGIPDSILFKRGKLSAEEWLMMRSHPARGEEICRPMASLKPVLPLIRHHHERWDGSGYPDGLRGEQIPLGARVLQVADIYDALVSPRPYKPAYSPQQSLQIMRNEAECGWRDPAIVDLFLGMHDKVITKISEYTAGADRSLQTMRDSLRNLQDLLNTPS